MLYILIAIVIFGILIALHEFGHFITAKLLGVRVNEFAIGMGPLLWSTTKGETQYSLRAIPIGGFCAMEGEDEATDDPGSFSNKPGWKKFIVLVAGSFMNFLTGLVLLLVVYSQAVGFVTPVIAGFMDGFPNEGADGLMVGDRILSVNGERIYTKTDIDLFFERAGGEAMDLVVLRDGEKIVLDDFPLIPRAYDYEGETRMMYGLTFAVEEATPLVRIQQSWYTSLDMVRMVRLSLVDLFTGKAGVKDMSGVIGIMDVMGQAGEEGAQAAAESGGSPFLGALMSILNLSAFIAINLAVMNLLPIPALDGGRIFFLVVNWLFTLVTRRKLDPKYEGYVHMAGFVLLLLLMVVVAFNDVVRIIT